MKDAKGHGSDAKGEQLAMRQATDLRHFPDRYRQEGSLLKRTEPFTTGGAFQQFAQAHGKAIAAGRAAQAAGVAHQTGVHVATNLYRVNDPHYSKSLEERYPAANYDSTFKPTK